MDILGIINLPIWLVLLVILITSLYLFMSKRYSTFDKLGIPGPRPWPFLGNVATLFKEGLMKFDINLKKKYGKVVGTYMGFTPQLIVYDEEIISQVTVKQFQKFTNRLSRPSGDKAFDLSLLALQDDQWKKMRGIMSPTFTTGKLKMMTKEINRCSREFVEVLSSEEEFDSKDSAGAFTMSVIASTAFGLNVNSQKDKDNPFLKYGKAIMEFNFKNPILWLAILVPGAQKLFRKLFGYSIVNKGSMNFFKEVIRQTVEGKARETDKSRADFVQLMVNAQRGEDIRDDEDKTEGSKSANFDFSQDHIIANAFLFFLAGYETTSQALGLLLYSLAANPECQQKVYDEIESVINNDKDEVDYNMANKMPYLDQCINESLRLYPPGPRVDRTCKEDTEINGVKISKGMSVVIPIYALHYDPDVYPEPEKFDPERFSPEEKAKRSPISWMPFGYGPRNCIGLRLALFEIKVAVVHVLRKHKIVVSEKTKTPLEFSKARWLKVQGGLWLKLVAREDESDASI